MATGKEELTLKEALELASRLISPVDIDTLNNINYENVKNKRLAILFEYATDIQEMYSKTLLRQV